MGPKEQAIVDRAYGHLRAIQERPIMMGAEDLDDLCEAVDLLEQLGVTNAVSKESADG
jgi:predicted TIM-barrel enzyme